MGGARLAVRAAGSAQPVVGCATRVSAAVFGAAASALPEVSAELQWLKHKKARNQHDDAKDIQLFLDCVRVVRATDANGLEQDRKVSAVTGV